LFSRFLSSQIPTKLGKTGLLFLGTFYFHWCVMHCDFLSLLRVRTEIWLKLKFDDSRTHTDPFFDQREILSKHGHVYIKEQAHIIVEKKHKPGFDSGDR